jgi:hypothetical protein
MKVLFFGHFISPKMILGGTPFAAGISDGESTPMAITESLLMLYLLGFI